RQPHDRAPRRARGADRRRHRGDRGAVEEAQVMIAMFIEAWGVTMLTTALLVAAVLLVRKPFARQFGPRLTYALWAIPALRFVLPPLPFADPVSAAVPPVSES